MLRKGPILTLLAAIFAATLLSALEAQADPADRYFAEQWGLHNIKAPQAWGTSAGRNVVVAVIDTGVDFDHEDLKGKSAGSYNCLVVSDGGCSSVQPAVDDVGHGTHVAGIIAATTNNSKGVSSVAPEAKIMALKVCGKNGCSGSAVSRAIRFAADRGAKVINMSLGTDLNLPLDTADWAADLDYAAQKGTLVVVASGNNSGAMSSYALAPNTVVVGSSGPRDERASYSTGSNLPGGADIDIYAPGGNAESGCDASDCVMSSVPGSKYAALQGTSMASPHAAGVAALLMCLGYNNQTAADRLIQTGDQVAAGLRVNAAKAVSAKPAGGACAGTYSAAPTQSKQQTQQQQAQQQAQQQQQQAQQQQQQAANQGGAAPSPTGEGTKVASEQQKKSNKMVLNVIIAAALAAMFGGWFGWDRLKAARRKA